VDGHVPDRKVVVGRTGRGKKIVVLTVVLAMLTGYGMRMGLAIALAVAIPVLDAVVGCR